MGAVTGRSCSAILVVAAITAIGAIAGLAWILSLLYVGYSPAYRVVTPPAEGRLLVEQIWSNDDDWASIDADRRTPGIYGLRGVHSDGTEAGWMAEVCRVGEDGSIESAIGIAGKEDAPNTYFRVYRRDALGALGFVCAGVAVDRIHAFAEDGSARWERRLPKSIKDIAACDLDGDGADEIVVGASEGVFALSGTGEDLWCASEGRWIDVVVGLGAVGGDRGQVLASGHGPAWLLDGEGRVVRSYKWDKAPFTITVAGAATGGQLLVGARPSPFNLQALAYDGTIQWSVRDDDARVRRAFFLQPQASPDGERIAVAFKDGQIMFYDASTGDRVGDVRSPQWPYPSIAWRRASDGSDMLVVASVRGMTAYRVRAESK